MKKNVTIRIEENNLWKIKENAAKAKMGFGEYISNAGTIIDPFAIKAAVDSSGVPAKK